MALNPGDTLLNGQYRIRCLLGRGGFGFVYHAVDTYVDEPVAIKELIPALLSDETLLKRFLAEAKTTMRLTHPHIVRTYHVFPEGGNYYIVMEYLAGGSLEERLQKEGRLAVDEAVRIAIQVCDGLSCAHDRGIVHCDLKPANVLFAADGTVKIADFGIAHVPEEMLTRSWATPAGFVAGTLPYMSPEQAEGVRDDPRMDLYSLGAVLYRMLTGKTYLSFDLRETPGAQADNVLRIRNDPPTPPRAHEPSIPIWLNDIVLKALNKECSERFDSAVALKRALERQVPVAPSIVSSVGALEPTRTRPKARAVPRGTRAWFWAVAGGVSILAVSLVVVLVALIPPAMSGRSTTTPGFAVIVTATVIQPRPSPGALPTLSQTSMPTPSYTPAGSLSELEPVPSPSPTLTPSSTSTTTFMGTDLPTETSTAAWTETPTAPWTEAPPATPPPSLPPSLGRIAYVSWLGNSNEIAVMNGDGTQEQRLTSNDVDDWDPMLSLDGKVIVFMSTRDGDEELYRMNSRGGEVTRLTSTPGRDRWPCFGPDGKTIAFTSARDGHAQIYLMDLDGKVQRNLSRNSAAERDPAFSPNGELIVFVSNRDGSDDLYLMNSDGRGVTRLTKSPGADWEPSFSPDESKILYVYDGDGNQEVYLLDLSSGKSINLTRNQAQDRDPAFAPDGSRIVFASDREGVWRLFVMAPDGSGVRKLTNGQADWAPSWSR